MISSERAVVRAASAVMLCAGSLHAVEGAKFVGERAVSVRAAAGSLQLRSGTVNLATRTNLLRAEQAQLRDGLDLGIIVLAGAMTPEMHDALAAANVTPVGYLPTNAHLTNLDGVDLARLANTAGVVGVFEYDSTWRVDSALLAQPNAAIWATDEFKAVALQGMHAAKVWIAPGARADDFSQWLATQAGAQVLGSETVGTDFVVNALLTPQMALALRDREDVYYAEPMPELSDRSNTTARWVLQSNINSQQTIFNRGITGIGQIMGVIDSGPTATHCSFNDPVNPIGPAHRKILAYNAPLANSAHGTHVTCTAVGDDPNTNDLRGHAPGAKFVFNIKPAISESDMYGRFDLHRTQGATVHTNSYGNNFTTAYDGLCRAIDRFSHDDEDSIVIFAVANGASLKNPENAKNCLAVASSKNFPLQEDYHTGGAAPTIDGRRKPEVTAPGLSINSAAANTACGVSILSGTSMAAPAVAGQATLIRQYFTEGFYPTGVLTTGNEIVPSGALLRAMLTASADDMNGLTGYPNVFEGFGRVLTENVLYFPGDARKLYVKDIRNTDPNAIVTGGACTLRVSVQSAAEPLRIVMAFTDQPAAVNAALAPVNDIDLVVVGPNGDIYTGNDFDFLTGQTLTTGVRDPLNTIEMVQLSLPAAGKYTILVEGTAVNVGTQGFAVVATGDVVPVTCNDIDFNNDNVFPDLQDIVDFVSVYGSGLCSTGNCDSLDFNNDDVVPDLQDFEDFIRVYGSGPCEP